MKNLSDLLELKPNQAYTSLLDATLGVATRGERGYHPVYDISFDTYKDACDAADSLNMRDGKTMKGAYKIVISSMRIPL